MSHGGRLHEDDNCLSALRFNEHGRMVMAAQEFRSRAPSFFLNIILSHDGMVRPLELADMLC